MSNIKFSHITLSSVVAPTAGQTIIGYDIDGVLKQKDSTNTITPIGGSGGPTPSLQSVLDTGSTATLGSNFMIGASGTIHDIFLEAGEGTFGDSWMSNLTLAHNGWAELKSYDIGTTQSKYASVYVSTEENTSLLQSYYFGSHNNRIAVESSGCRLEASNGTDSATLNISYTDNQCLFTDNRPSTSGIEYAGDYSSYFNDRSLVDKAYADRAGTFKKENGIISTVGATPLFSLLQYPTGSYSYVMGSGYVAGNGMFVFGGNDSTIVNSAGGVVFGENTLAYIMSGLTHSDSTTTFSVRDSVEDDVDWSTAGKIVLVKNNTNDIVKGGTISGTTVSGGYRFFVAPGITFGEDLVDFQIFIDGTRYFDGIHWKTCAASFAAGSLNYASGPFCAAFGRSNSVVGLGSFVSGIQNTVSGNESFCHSYNSSSPRGVSANNAAILGGSRLTVHGNFAAAIGGSGNSVYGENSIILGGYGQSVSLSNTVAVPSLYLTTVPPEHVDNAAALVAGLTAGQLYRTGDLLKVVH